MSHALFLTNESRWSCRSYSTKLQDSEWETVYVNPVFLWDTVCQHHEICWTASDTRLTVGCFPQSGPSINVDSIVWVSLKWFQDWCTCSSQDLYSLFSTELHIPKGRLGPSLIHRLYWEPLPTPLPSIHTHPNPQSLPLPPNNTQPHVPAVHE